MACEQGRHASSAVLGAHSLRAQLKGPPLAWRAPGAGTLRVREAHSTPTLPWSHSTTAEEAAPVTVSGKVGVHRRPRQAHPECMRLRVTLRGPQQPPATRPCGCAACSACVTFVTARVCSRLVVAWPPSRSPARASGGPADSHTAHGHLGLPGSLPVFLVCGLRLAPVTHANVRCRVRKWKHSGGTWAALILTTAVPNCNVADYWSINRRLCSVRGPLPTEDLGCVCCSARLHHLQTPTPQTITPLPFGQLIPQWSNMSAIHARSGVMISALLSVEHEVNESNCPIQPTQS